MKNNKKVLTFTSLTSVSLGMLLSLPTMVQATTLEVEPNQEHQKVVQTSETTDLINTKTFILSDWTYSETDDTIILSKYNGSATSIYIPGQYGGKQIIIKDFSIFPNTMTNLTLDEINGVKVGLEKKTLNEAFHNHKNIVALDLSGLDVSKVYSMDSAFQDAINLTTLNVNGWDTSKVEYMNHMFSGAQSLTMLDVRNWDVSNVKTMSNMFYNARSLTTLDVSNWNTSNVTNMSGIFYNNKLLTTLDVSNWDTSKVLYMDRMFYNTLNLSSLDVSDWNTSSVTNMSWMFYNNQSLTALEVSNWNTSNVTDMSWMFCDTNSLNTLDVSNWDTSNVTDMSFMFNKAQSLMNLDVSNWDTSSVTTIHAIFSGMASLEMIDVSNWNTSNVFDMRSVFSDINHSITVINLNNWDTSNVWYMDDMFFSEIQTPLLLITKDERLKKYDFERDSRTGLKMTLNTNEGTFLNGNKTFVSDEINVIESVEQEFIERYIQQILENQGVPTRQDYYFNKWDGPTFNSNDLNSIFNALNGTYEATWSKPAIIINQAPTIQATDQVLTVGDEFNPLKGVIATDNEDGDIVLTETNIVSNDVDLLNPGTYHITYKVSDSEGATVTKMIQVIVNPKLEDATDKIPDEDLNDSTENENQDTTIDKENGNDKEENQSKPNDTVTNEELKDDKEIVETGLSNLSFVGMGALSLVSGIRLLKNKKR